MKRRLVKQGAATLMVSLPAKWIKQNKLNKGSEINIEETDHNIIISPEEIKTKSKIKIKLIDLTESSIRTLITNTYRRGYDKIEVEFENENQFKILKKVIKTRLIGFDIIKKEVNKCIVENITEPSSDQFNNIINKIFLSIEELFETTKRRLTDPKEDFEEVEERIQKYDNFCRRVISKRKLLLNNSEMFWTFLTLVNHGQREIYHLNKLLAKKTNSKEIKELLEESEKIFKLIKKAYLEKNKELFSKIHRLEKEAIYKKGYSYLQKNKESKIIYHIMLSAREFYQSNSPLLGIILSTSI